MVEQITPLQCIELYMICSRTRVVCYELVTVTHHLSELRGPRESRRVLQEAKIHATSPSSPSKTLLMCYAEF